MVTNPFDASGPLRVEQVKDFISGYWNCKEYHNFVESIQPSIQNIEQCVMAAWMRKLEELKASIDQSTAWSKDGIKYPSIPYGAHRIPPRGWTLERCRVIVNEVPVDQLPLMHHAAGLFPEGMLINPKAGRVMQW